MEGEQQRYERAYARVQALTGFFIHASAFVVVNLALLAINVLVGGGGSTGRSLAGALARACTP
jgi:2TM domain-containing protein